MTRIAAIVCGAGVSSTFLARAVRSLVVANGLDWTVEPLAEDQLASRADDLSVVLVGRHLADHLGTMQTALDRSGVPVHLLPAGSSTDVVDHCVALLRDLDLTPSAAKGHPHG